jgi:alanine-glyoxylate transaminase/serine-glyoxylate transaminase/serine-pyruvate transaminase
VLAASFGQFSHLWIDMCQRLEFEVQVLDTEWGEGDRLSAIATRLPPTGTMKSKPCW